MGITFRERLASDPYFSIRIKEPEKLCPYSDKIHDEEHPDSVDHESKIRMMNTEEWRLHVRKAQELQMLDEQTKKEEGERLLSKKRVAPKSRDVVYAGMS